MRIVGDCREVLRDLPKGSVQMVCTSPPYWGLRNYGVKNQIGLERTPELFVQQMVEVFALVRDVLSDDGTLWLNMGDCYASGPTGTHRQQRDPRAMQNNSGWTKREQGTANTLGPGLKPKDLCGMPWRVAFALQADGWYLRSDIIWHKPNPMPESVTDRPTKSHEYLFLLTKSPRYFYDSEAIREPFADERMGNPGNYRSSLKLAADITRGQHGNGVTGDGWNEDGRQTGRNRRTVWTITPKPFKGAHFATFPPKLVEPCILAGTSEVGHCPAPGCGKRWVRVVERSSAEPARIGAWKATGAGHRRDIDRKGGFYDAHTETLGFRPTCDHGKKPVPDVVLDPFGGSGTTAEVAQRLGRDWVMIELNPKYGRLIDERVQRAA